MSAEPSPEASGPRQRPALRSAGQLRNAKLPTAFRGYDIAATNALLAEVATLWETAQRDRDRLVPMVDRLQAEHDRVTAELDALREELGASEQTLSRALLAAGRASEDLIREAEIEAERIRDVAAAEQAEARRALDADLGARREESARLAAAIEQEAHDAASELVAELQERRAEIERERIQVHQEARREALAALRGELHEIFEGARHAHQIGGTLLAKLRAIDAGDVPAGRRGPLRPAEDVVPELLSTIRPDGAVIQG